jgi:hypothetical protein
VRLHGGEIHRTTFENRGFAGEVLFFRVTVFANATQVLTQHNRSVILTPMNSKQFKKWLASQGATSVTAGKKAKI